METGIMVKLPGLRRNRGFKFRSTDRHSCFQNVLVCFSSSLSTFGHGNFSLQFIVRAVFVTRYVPTGIG